ncbi:hypothetical protein ACOMHN_046501 [Nucella lapillus]
MTLSAVNTSDNTDVSGDLSVLSQTVQTAKLLDFETTPAYSVTLIIQGNTGNKTVKFTLQVNDVNDETPTLPTVSNTFSVNWDEEQDVNSQVFPPFTVKDADAIDTQNKKYIFELTGSQAKYFTVNKDTGAITANTKMDRDAGSTTVFNQLFLTVTDAGGNTSPQKQLTVTLKDVNDNAPTCTPSLYIASLAENTGVGVTVASLTCSDVDASPNGDIKKYVISSGDDTPAKFTVSNSGKVVTTAQALNFETKTLYTLVFSVQDGGATPNIGSATVNVQVTHVNEAAPVFGVFTPAGLTFTKPESVSINTPIVTVTATDTDADVDGQLVYSIVSVKDCQFLAVCFCRCGVMGVVLLLYCCWKQGRKEARKEGRKKGRKQGRTQGRKEARKEAGKEASKKGRKQGRTQGRKEARKEARN